MKRFEINMDDLNQCNDILYQQMGCDREWIEKLKALDLSDGDDCIKYYDSIQKRYLEICNMSEELSGEMENLLENTRKYRDLNEEINTLENAAEKLYVTINFSIFYYLCKFKCIPNELALTMTNLIFDEIEFVPVFWNILSKSRDLMHMYSLMKIKQDYDFSAMEYANQDELDFCSDSLRDLFEVLDNRQKIMN